MGKVDYRPNPGVVAHPFPIGAAGIQEMSVGPRFYAASHSQTRFTPLALCSNFAAVNSPTISTNICFP
jgi:hypothetical protein